MNPPTVLQEFLVLFRKSKELDARRKALKDEINAKKEQVQTWLEQSGAHSISFGDTVIKLKQVNSKPSITEDFLIETLAQKIPTETANELVSFIVDEQRNQVRHKTDLQIKLGKSVTTPDGERRQSRRESRREPGREI